MNANLIRAQLSAMRSQLDVLHATIDSMLIALNDQPSDGPTSPAPELGACPQCGAPEAMQVVATTFQGPPLTQCTACRTEYTR